MAGKSYSKFSGYLMSSSDHVYFFKLASIQICGTSVDVHLCVLDPSALCTAELLGNNHNFASDNINAAFNRLVLKLS